MLSLLAALLFSNASLATPFCQVLLNREHDGEVELTMRVEGFHAGLYRYRMVGDKDAYVTGIFMQDAFKRQRLSSAFVHAMLLRNPEIRKVKALMVMDNLAASGLVWVKRQITNEECKQAARGTPFAKAFAHFDFELSRCYWNPELQFLEIEVSR